MNRIEKSKIADAAIVYMICLMLTGAAASFLLPYIGLWVLIFAFAADIAVVIAAVRIGHVKKEAVFRFGNSDFGSLIASVLVYSSALLIIVPIYLFGHLLVPNFAVSAFRVSDYVVSAGGWWLVALLTVVSSTACAFLFEGYVYTRLRGIKSLPLRIATVAVVAGFFRLDLYVILPFMVAEAAIVISRRITGSLVMPIALQIITSVLAMSVTELTSDAERLPGVSMGAMQVSGLAMICIAAAIAAGIAALAVKGKFGKLSLAFRLSAFILALVLVAVGCAISAS